MVPLIGLTFLSIMVGVLICYLPLQSLYMRRIETLKFAAEKCKFLPNSVTLVFSDNAAWKAFLDQLHSQDIPPHTTIICDSHPDHV